MQPFAIFSFWWALSGLFDLAPFHDAMRSPVHVLFAGVSLAVLWRPGSLVLFGAMNALRVAVFAVDSPHTANHVLLFAFAAATVLAAFPLAACRAGSWREVDGERWREAFAPVLRVELLTLYAFAVLHKLNHDYLDPELSCAVSTFFVNVPWLAEPLLERLPLQPLLVGGSLLAEVSIPILLAWRPTRRWGIAGGILFHVLLSLRFHNFSTGLVALYTCFVPASVFAAWAQPSPRTALALRCGALAVVGGFGLAGWVPAAVWARGLFLGLLVLWAATLLGGCASLLTARAARPYWGDPAPGRLRESALLVGFAVLLLPVGLSPYLGLRTVPAFSMFSNLRTEGARTNHLFMPDSALRIAGYQEDLVTVLESHGVEMKGYATRPRRVFWDLRRHIQDLAAAGQTGIVLRYRRAGEEVALERAEEDPILMEPIPWWERKLLHFRAVPRRGRPDCTW